MIARLRRNDLLLHGAIVFGGLIVANAFNYLYYMLAGRVLGVEAYGELTALSSAALALAAPANVAQIIVARVAADFQAAGDAAALRRLTRTATVWTLGAVTAVVAAGLLSARPLANFFHIPSTLPVIAATLGLGLFAFVTVQRGILQGTHRFTELSASFGIEALVRLATGIPLAVTAGAFGGLVGLVVGCLACIGYHAWILRDGAEDGTAAARIDTARLIEVAWRIGFAQLMLTVLSAYDVALVRHVISGRSAGLYAAASLVGRVVLGVMAFVPTLIMPKTTARASTGASALPLLGAALGVSAAIAACAALVSALAPRTVVMLIAGRAFGDAGAIVVAYVAAAGALGLANVVAAYQIGLHRYAFVGPALAVALAEIAAIALWHPSLAAVVTLLAAGHGAFLAVTFIGVGGTERRA